MKLKKVVSAFTLAAVSAVAVGCSTNGANVDLSTINPIENSDSSILAADSKNGAIIPGEFIVKFKTTAAKNSLTALNSVGAKKVKDISNTNMSVIRVSSATATNSASIMNSIKSNPNIEWIEANRTITLPKFIRDVLDRISGRTDAFPNDPKFADQYAHVRTDSVKGWNKAKANAKRESIIAIVDTGIDGTHPDLKAKLLPGYDAYGEGKEYSDKQGHGTHCAGISAAITNNGVGVAGYSPDSKLIAVKALQDSGSGTYAAVADAIAWAAKSKADVISMSLGGPSTSQAIEEAVKLAIANDKVVVAASGNSGNNAAPSYPAAVPGVIAVGATDSSDKIASFSQGGQHLSVSAPGVKIMSTFPTYASGMPSKDYGSISGTSMACPAVSGLAGLLKSVNPSLKNSQIREIMEKTADDLGDAKWDRLYGHGRINVLKAVEAAVGGSTAARK